MDNLMLFLGRLHPLVVHLPIGILALAICLHLLGRWPRYAALRDLLPVLWFAGAVTAVLACLAGLLLKAGGGYDEAAVTRHQYLGMALAAVTVGLFLARSRGLSRRLQTPAVLVVAGLLLATGHYGGNLTHGDDYLAQPFYAMIGRAPAPVKRPPITDIRQALVYQDLVAPVLEQKCYQCHSAKKQKGRLRLDTKEFVRQGGEHGQVVVAGEAEKSPLYRRLLLPETHNDHMPPRGKPQLTDSEIRLVHWWIVAGGADFDKKVADLPADPELESLLAAASQQPGASSQAAVVPEMPAVKVAPARPADLQRLQRLGVVLTPVAQGSPFLSANFVNAGRFSDADMPLLASLRDQLLWLDMSATSITDKSLGQLRTFKHLTRLSLDNTAVTDTGLLHLAALPNLRYLNLYGTRVSDQGLKSLAGCRQLRALYLWQTQVTPAGVAALQQARGPGIEINFGGTNPAPETL